MTFSNTRAWRQAVGGGREGGYTQPGRSSALDERFFVGLYPGIEPAPPKFLAPVPWSQAALC